MRKKNMGDVIPVVQGENLTYQRSGQDERLLVGTSAWYTWLGTARSFAFRSAWGTFTARKEQASNKRGGEYWRAYRRRDSQLHRVYLGKSEDLTLDRLHAVAAALAGQAAVDEDKPEPIQHALPLAMDISQPLTVRPSTLPLQLTSLIGREREVAAACTLLLRPEVRLLTLTGTAGVGKTRLALAIASEVKGNFADGVCFVSLAPLADADLVLPTIVQALGLHSSTRAPLEQLQVALREQELLLLLDNFEQVVEASPPLVELLTSCTHLTLLVTSREVLHVRGEHAFLVPPLPLPDLTPLPDCATLSRYGAVALFLARAQEAQSTFQLSDEQAPLVVEICRRLDGLPLALELAAARLTLLSLPALLERLSHRLAVLTSGPRDLPERQQTMRTTIAWSYGLLSQEEQRLFRLFYVFVGGATLEAVEVMSGMLGGENVSVLDGVVSLLDKHLLSRTEQETVAPRLLMLETVREYGLEALATSQELEAARLAHAQYYLALAEEAEAHLFVQDRGFQQLEREYGNLRAALRWCMEREDGQRRDIAWRLIGALQLFWIDYGYGLEGQRFVEHALGRREGVPAAVQAKALNGVGTLALWQGEDERAEALCQESLELYRELHDPRGMAIALYRLGQIALSRGDYPVATSRLQESLVLYREVGEKVLLAFSLTFLALTTLSLADQRKYPQVRLRIEESLALFREERSQVGSAWALYCLGVWHFQQGEAATAHALFEESLALSRTVQAPTYISYVLYYLGKVAAVQGDFPTAHIFYQQALALFQELGDQRSLAACLESWGGVVARQGDDRWAAQLWGAAEVLREASGPSALLTLITTPDERADAERLRPRVRAELGEQAFAQDLAEGRTMTPEQALSAQAHSLLATHPPASAGAGRQQVPSPSATGDLTEREVEVLRLVARGLTDAQVADLLVVSPRTVNAHLRSIYSKLGITSRHAATLFALQHQLI
jgi:predicted ATPase/DNA-binding CsgD family transcriptional regulator